MKSPAACFAAAIAVLSAAPPAPAAETIATFTRNPSNPILRGVRIGGEIAATSLGAKVVHFIPRSEAPPEQLGLVDEVLRNKPDAIVLAPFDPKAMVPAVDKLNAAGIPVINVNDRLAGGNVSVLCRQRRLSARAATARTCSRRWAARATSSFWKAAEARRPASTGCAASRTRSRSFRT